MASLLTSAVAPLAGLLRSSARGLELVQRRGLANVVIVDVDSQECSWQSRQQRSIPATHMADRPQASKWNDSKTARSPRPDRAGPDRAGEVPPPRLKVSELLGDAREAILEHGGVDYRLRITANRKLILTK